MFYIGFPVFGSFFLKVLRIRDISTRFVVCVLIFMLTGTLIIVVFVLADWIIFFSGFGVLVFFSSCCLLL